MSSPRTTTPSFCITVSSRKAIVSSRTIPPEIIDVLRAAGIESPDISILSDDFLAELQGMERKNLALEALKKLLNGEIKSRLQTNVVERRRRAIRKRPST
ncbi:DUF3387 domain-containing protein [Ruegeria pomeroyi]|nr:DUF3387 domain-containing protein [Ruegeria pomeroyi]